MGSEQAKTGLGEQVLLQPTRASGQVFSEPIASQGPLERVATRNGRLEFLDALRGVAALLVAMQHAAEILSPRYLRWSVERWRPGEFGVVLFFLCSGFIIPASLEKYDSLKRFWIGRLFRLMPLYWFTLAVILGLQASGMHLADNQLRENPVLVIVTNLTMLQLFLNLPLIVGASWTLAYEMVFYLFCSVLLLSRLNKKSVPIAFLVLCAAGGTGFYLPGMIFSQGHVSRGGVSFALFASCAFAFVCARNPSNSIPRRLGIALLATLVACLTLNGPHASYLTFSFFGAMTTGTVLYRGLKKEAPQATVLKLVAFALLATFIACWVNVPDVVDPSVANAHHTWKPEALTFVSAYLVFAGAFWLSNRRFPGVLMFLGKISYSIYLVHAVVIHVAPRLSSRWLTFTFWNVLIVAVSWATYRLIEKPFQDMGHRIISGLDKERHRERGVEASLDRQDAAPIVQSG